MEQLICLSCNKKQSSQYVDQLMRIESIIRVKVSAHDKSNSIDSREIMSFVQAMTMSTQEHCRYGLYCQEIASQKCKADQKIREIAVLILRYVQTLDPAGLSDFLRYFQGYFPVGYRWIEDYWRKCVKEKM